MPTCQAYKYKNKTRIYSDTVWCFVFITSQKSEGNKFHFFANDGGKYDIDLSGKMDLVKEVSFPF